MNGARLAIHAFTIRTTPASEEVVLASHLTRQHSFSVPSATERIDIFPIFRHQGTGLGKRKIRGGEAAPTVEISARPHGIVMEEIMEKSEGEATVRYSLYPRAGGVSVAEFSVTYDGDEDVTEVYRLFIRR